MTPLTVGTKIQDQAGKVCTVIKHLPADGRPESWVVRGESGKERTWSTLVIETQFDYGNWKIVG